MESERPNGSPFVFTGRNDCSVISIISGDMQKSGQILEVKWAEWTCFNCCVRKKESRIPGF
jgi:hypothetical protein